MKVLVKVRQLVAAQHGVTEASEDVLRHLGHGHRGELGAAGLRRLPADADGRQVRGRAPAAAAQTLPRGDE